MVLPEPPNAGGAVYLFYPESLLDEAIADAVRPSFLGLAFGLVAVGLTFGIGQRLVARIRALERRTRQIAAGDFSPMPVPRANDELRDLTTSVNEMAERLARLQQAVQTTERLRLTGQLASGWRPTAQRRHGGQAGRRSLPGRARGRGYGGAVRHAPPTRGHGDQPAAVRSTWAGPRKGSAGISPW